MILNLPVRAGDALLHHNVLLDHRRSSLYAEFAAVHTQLIALSIGPFLVRIIIIVAGALFISLDDQILRFRIGQVLSLIHICI